MSKWLNTELGECRLVLQGDLCQWEFCLYSQLLIGIIVCQTLRVTDITHPSWIMRLYYKINFIMCSSSTVVKFISRSSYHQEAGLIVSCTLMLSFLKEIVSQALCIQLCLQSLYKYDHYFIQYFAGNYSFMPSGQTGFNWSLTVVKIHSSDSLFPLNFLSHFPYRPWDQPSSFKTEATSCSIYHHKETFMDCIACQIPFLQYLRHCTCFFILFWFFLVKSSVSRKVGVRFAGNWMSWYAISLVFLHICTLSKMLRTMFDYKKLFLMFSSIENHNYMN